MNYRRLSGRSLLPVSRSLYLGPDHLLSVRTTFLSEEYRRFYFRDIQALVLAETGHQLTYYLVTSGAFLALLCVLLAYNGNIVWAVLSGIGALFALAAGMRLPNCVCYLQTATSLERLRPLSRRGRARKALAILNPLILEAQGSPDKPGNE